MDSAKPAIPVVIIHKGDAFYLKHSAKVAKKFNPSSRIILLGSGINNKPKEAEYFDFSQYATFSNKMTKAYKHYSTNAFEVERFCFERWFMLYEFMQKENMEKCVYIDSDLLLFSNITEEAKRFEKFDFTLHNGTSAHCIFINSREGLKKFCDYVLEIFTDKEKFKYVEQNFSRFLEQKLPGGFCDMSAFKKYASENPSHVGEISEIHNSTFFDGSIIQPEGFEMAFGLKKITFKNGVPFGKLAKTGELIRMNCLHLQGPAKVYAGFFANAHSGKIVLTYGSVLRKARDFLGARLSKGQIKWVKRFLSKVM